MVESVESKTCEISANFNSFTTLKAAFETLGRLPWVAPWVAQGLMTLSRQAMVGVAHFVYQDWEPVVKEGVNDTFGATHVKNKFQEGIPSGNFLHNIT